jgi:hypothetical protein
VPRFLSAILALAVAAALAGSGKPAWGVGAGTSVLGEMPQALVGQGGRQDNHVVRQAKARGACSLGVPTGLLPAAAPGAIPDAGISFQAGPARIAKLIVPSFGSRSTRGPPGFDLPAVKS